ncbi:DUF4363 family protein [Sedimentibacter hydroxybenzoicus DSM 7310]|uniref:DUF4363 family protein n=1 Tax=Sedimentibacter hydroxybenzoicus DSM 7310 TaxID=1123245 RepID=A0A974BKL7_SEDHY|nr:DUF4363 family protein [Sedimentibacter hydroxybenzoicus]NYB74743.1 DUF4363 family protein [Sedimentibacter hydroxybenzoicus DSM 7310]
MRKFLVRAIPVASIILFILIMVSDNYLKHSYSENDNVVKSIELIMNDVNMENWDEANNKIADLNNAWMKIVKRVQFSAERNEINDFDKSVARLRGAILARDKAGAMMELSEAYEHWENLGK